MRILGKGVAVAACLLVLAFAATAGAARHGHHRVRFVQPIVTPKITLAASPTRVVWGQTVTLSGKATLPGSLVTLYKSPYPYAPGPGTPAGTTTTRSDGTFSFTETPDRLTRYTAAITGAQAQAVITVIVRSIAKVKVQKLGRGRVTIVVFHPSDLHWQGARVQWWFAHGRHGRFKKFPASRTLKLSSSAIVFYTSQALPAGTFRWRACVKVADDAAFSSPRKTRDCSGLGFFGSGRLPYGYPGPAAVARASRYLGSRAGRTAYAVVDTEDRMSGVHIHWTFVSASVVKAMLLVAYLRRLHAHGQHYVDGYSNSFLYPMINVSDNNAATQCWSIVGDSGLYGVAHAAHMTDFSIVGIWANAQISAADQAKFFFEMDSIIPKEFVGYARHLLSTIVGYESWGIPAVARPRGYQVFFKGGWRTTGLGQLVHQVGRLEGHHRRFSIAVMTDGDPDMGYGIGTIQGVTSALL